MELRRAAAAEPPTADRESRPRVRACPESARSRRRYVISAPRRGGGQDSAARFADPGRSRKWQKKRRARSRRRHLPTDREASNDLPVHSKDWKTVAAQRACFES